MAHRVIEMLFATSVLILQIFISIFLIRKSYYELDEQFKTTFTNQLKKGRYYVLVLFALGGLIEATTSTYGKTVTGRTIAIYGPAFLGFFIAMYKELIVKLRSWSFPSKFIKSTHVASILMLAGIIYFVINVYIIVFQNYV